MIFVVRHAPTAANAAGVFQGQSDVPAEVIVNPERYAVPAARPRTIFTSPLQRARTAADVLFPGEPAIVDERLMERSVGEWEGLDHDTVRQRWPAYGETDLDLMLTPPGGESVSEFGARVQAFLSDISGANTDTYIVTHNGWIRMSMLLNGTISRDTLFAESVPFMVPIPYAG
ncbi:histidine phosphatase family protein [Nocardioides sp.]|uniref:histidine phosphatase family protein n=1 Tax=Nocardioides sp. TaxID=35761 RepID=UPI003D11485C